MARLILASRSPHRLQLLRDAGYTVESIPSDVAEPELTSGEGLRLRLLGLAQTKVEAVARTGAEGLILGADTVGCVAGQVFGKPADRNDALRMLQTISGTTHEVLTGWCLLRTADRLFLSGVERTVIHMRSWTAQELEAYLDSRQWVEKSGAYGLETPVDPFVDRIEGSPSSVIGVPLERLQAVIDEFGLLK
jgi:septum formation protein